MPETLATFQDGELYNISWLINTRCLGGFWLRVWEWKKMFLAGNCMFKVNNRNTRTRYKICSKLTVQSETIGVVLLSLLYCQLWTYFKPTSNVSIAVFDQVNTGWLGCYPEVCIRKFWTIQFTNVSTCRFLITTLESQNKIISLNEQES